MAVLADVERFLERVFERSTARLFRAHVQPVQLERRVERAMERARSGSGGRTVVPGRYRVRVQPDDLREVADQAGGAEALAGRLADAALTFARAHAYHLPGRPGVSLVADPSLARGQVEVDAVAESPAAARASQPSSAASPSAAPGAPAAAAAAGAALGRGGAGARRRGRRTRSSTRSSPIARSATRRPRRSSRRRIRASAATGRRPSSSAAPRRPRPAPCSASWSPDGTERTIEVDGTPLEIGRSRDSGLVLADTKVSRQHGRLQARRGTLVYTDLGSTNGSRVNGIRVDEIALGLGDRLLLGDTVLVVESLPG